MSTELNLEEICSIIEKCKEHGVSEFSYQELKISFQARTDLANHELTSTQARVDDLIQIDDEETFHKENEEFSLKQQELIAKEVQWANMPLEDPVQYEEMLATGKGNETLDDLTLDEDYDAT